MKKILLVGAGRTATALVSYLKELAELGIKPTEQILKITNS